MIQYCDNCKEILKTNTDGICSSCGHVQARLVNVHDKILATDEEPIIEVTATPAHGGSITKIFPFSTSSEAISGSTISYIEEKVSEEHFKLVKLFIDSVKENYKAAEHKVVVTIKEKEEIDRGWFSHMSFGGKFNLNDNTIEAQVKSDYPKKERRTKETTIEISMKKKDD